MGDWVLTKQKTSISLGGGGGGKGVSNALSCFIPSKPW